MVKGGLELVGTLTYEPGDPENLEAARLLLGDEDLAELIGPLFRQEKIAIRIEVVKE